REMYLHILWNILKYPNKQALYNCLFSKCHTLNANLEQIIIDMEIYLQIIGFKKGNDDNWYYQYDHIQMLYLWTCYQAVIIYQTMYCYKNAFICRIGIPERVCILSNGKWKDYWILFDYQHRTIMLFDENKSKIKLLQVGNPNKSSLEFN
ncbi:hypothetical protein RFI_35504, partial [Reticulomyxa filosa]